MCNKRRIICRWPGLVLIISFLFISIHVWAQAEPEFAIKGKGSFYLVGMGPGDPDFATVRAMKIVQEADLIICSRPLEEKLTFALMDKEAIVVPATMPIWHGYGKQENNYQGYELEKFRESEKARGQLITKVRAAIKQGKTVAVLACGDPLIYGRWIWCLEEFQDLDPVVVPGISSFSAANAVLKKDISYSDTCKSIIITTDDRPGKRDTIEKLSGNQATMVICTMGIDLKKLVSKLSIHYSPQTPVSIVCYTGNKEKECVIKGTLGTIPDKTKDMKLPLGYLVFVGKNIDFSQRPGTTKDVPKGSKKGSFYLVGMGAGDPDLATIRAMKVVEEADLIYCHDSLKERFSHILDNKEVIIPPEYGWIWYGYGKRESDFQGKELERFLVCKKVRGQIIVRVRQAIKEGKKIAILDHGDPLVYGPWVWVLEEFADLKPTVIPGISSFNAASAILKKEVTSGKNTKSVILTTPDVAEWLERNAFDMDRVASHQVTMVIFMPSYNTELKNLAAKLSAYYPRETPIALVVYAGFKEKERVIQGTLDNIVEKVGNEKLPFEHLMYVGDFLSHGMKTEKEE